MKKFRSTPLGKLLTNKYFLTVTAFVVWMLFVDRNDVWLQYRRMSELHQLQESEEAMRNQILDTRKELRLLKTNPATLEKYAREKYLMKRENEDLYIISHDSTLIR